MLRFIHQQRLVSDVMMLCACGCGQQTKLAAMTSKRDGHVKGQPQRFLLGHGRRLQLWTVLFQVRQDGECLRFQGPHSRDGYGSIGSEGAHRVAYKAFVGPIPDGHQLDHARARGCRFRDCINVEHLEPVEQLTNWIRGDAPSAVNARKTHCGAGHPLTAENLSPAKLRGGRRACRVCMNATETARRQRTRAAARRAC